LMMHALARPTRGGQWVPTSRGRTCKLWAGSEAKGRIGPETKLDAPILALLAEAVAAATPISSWIAPRAGSKRRYRVASERKQHDAARLPDTALRALDALERPMSQADLADRLGVSRQRTHQIVMQLYEAGRVRLGFAIVGRADDPTPLLSREEQRVLSALAEGYATTLAKVRLHTKIKEEAAARALKRLRDLGLLADAGQAAGSATYCLTAAGAAHPQYQRAVGRAAPPALPVRSDRVCAVLAFLAERRGVQIPDVSDALGIEYHSVNALFQHLKRKALAMRDTAAPGAPYILTAEGRQVLAEMQRQRAA
jgi:DNA-binding IclR family transcriptional regulator